MYVCICNAVREQDIRLCAARGASSLKELEQCLGVGTNCGKCRAYAQAVLDDAAGDDLRGAAQRA